uniref:Shisa N-terminal domain-containing protein n=1 Tax=Neolamprologus brichardi TaxID=32507 RepID=A0A3Q4M8B3_NEOBR
YILIFGSTLTLSSLYPRSCLTDDLCHSYVDMFGVSHDAEKCSKYCCGTCNLRYCCKDKPKQLNQKSCSGSSESTSQIGLIVGIVVGSLILLLCVVLIICCLAPCCLCYMKCQKRPTQRQISKLVTVTSSDTVNNEMSFTSYRHVLSVLKSVSFVFSANPTHSVLFTGEPMYPLQPPSQATAPPPYSEDPQPAPYNPSHNPRP